MFQQQVQIINTILMVLDAFCVIVSGYVAFYLMKFLTHGAFTIESDIFIASILVVMITNNYCMGKFRLYGDKKIQSSKQLVWPLSKTVLVDFAVLASVLFMLKMEYDRDFMLLFAAVTFVSIFSQRFIAHWYINKVAQNKFNLHYILIVGPAKRGNLVKEIMDRQLSWGHKIIGRLSLVPEDCADGDCLGQVEHLPDILRNNEIDEVIFALNGDKSVVLSDYLHICRRMGVLVRILPSLWHEDDSSLSVEKCQTMPFITIKTDNLNATGLLYKRVMDMIGGVVGTIIFCILYPFVGLAIKLDSKGPVLFKQKRVGQHGRIFNLYKFRSMYEDAEERKKELMTANEMNGSMFKIQNDPRVTKVGRWLRKTSLDEFPQFINVLKGEMSLVGTRPPTPDEVKTYNPDHLRRLSAKPGITGLWQVSGRNQVRDFDKVVALDCQYLEHWRFSDDIKILFKTVYVVLKRKGAI